MKALRTISDKKWLNGDFIINCFTDDIPTIFRDIEEPESLIGFAEEYLPGHVGDIEIIEVEVIEKKHE